MLAVEAAAAVAAFSGGVCIRNAIEELPIPKLRRRTQGVDNSFKLSLRVVGASAPALAPPGFLSRQRPRLEVSLGSVQKDTEFADYEADGAALPCARECPWRFGDALTFMVKIKDVLGPGLRLRLRALSDVTLGPVQFQLSSVAELGEACVDLRRRALPGCVRDASKQRPGAAEVWQSPVLLIPLSHVRGGQVCEGQELGQSVGHVALAFSLDTDPEEILEALDAETRTVKEVITGHANTALGRANNVLTGHANNVKEHANKVLEEANNVKQQANRHANTVLEQANNVKQRANKVLSWLGAPVGSSIPENSELAGYFPARTFSDAAAGEVAAEPRGTCGRRAQQGNCFSTLTTSEGKLAANRAAARRASVPTYDRPLPSPDEAPDVWVSRKGPGGRLYWHNRRLGPAPWESQVEDSLAPEPVAAGGCRSLARSARADSFGPPMSPDLPPDGWTCHKNRDGRTFWHHTSLGPPPWERPSTTGGSFRHV